MNARVERAEKIKKGRMQEQICVHLLQAYGPVIGAEKLWSILSYKSRQAFDRSVQRNKTALPLFRPQGRDGVFILAPELFSFATAEYLVTVAQTSLIRRDDAEIKA